MARGFSYAPGASPEFDEAMQPGLHRAHVQALSQSKNWLVREVIGSREDCPLGVMVGLAHDSHQEVRAAVAKNRAIARTVMEHLARDRAPEVVIALIGNPAVDMDIVESLAYHKRADIRGAASARLDAGVEAVPDAADAAIPELRERVEAYDESRVYDFATGKPVELHFEADRTPAPAPPQPERVAPTRTAPIRGFRIDNVG
jgi:hypothetical protein